MAPEHAERVSAVSRAVRLTAIAAVYLIACCVMLAPICNFAHLGTAVFGGDVRLIVWTLAWDNHAVLARVPALFDANMFYPASEALAYSEHLFGISLFTLPVYALTHNPALAYNVVWILSYLLAAASAHYLTWRYTRDHLAATVAGLAYALCFYRMHHGHGHLHLLWGFWIPVSLIAMERWLADASWRRLWLFVAVVSLQALSSWYQAVMIFVADALFMLWFVVLEPAIARQSVWTRERIVRIAVQSAAGALVALAVVWPFARHYHVLTSGGPVEVAASSADAAAYLMPPENTFVGQWLIARGVKGPRWIWGELTVYAGWITMALAMAGAIVAVRGHDSTNRRLRFFILLGVIAIVLAAGPSAAEVKANAWGLSPFGMLARIPGADLFRVPARFAALLTLALAVLAGAACAASHARFGRAGRILTILAIPLLLADYYLVNFPGGPPVPLPVPAVYRFIATLPPGPVVSLPDYAGTGLWFQEADYQYFSTAHWYPIANGYSRTEPPGFSDRMHRIAAFPDAAAVSTMRETGIRYLVVHAGQYPAGGADAVERGRASGGFRLLARFDADYLFEIE
jgi:hypothetical protein